MRPTKRFTRIFRVIMLLTSSFLTLSCATDSGTVEAINSASASRRNIIGVELANIANTQRASTKYGGEGVYVSAVIPHHPASMAGVKAGDIIMSINSIPVANVSEALMVISELEGGRKYPFRIYRMTEKSESKYLIAHVLIFKANILVEKVQERAIGRIS